jgi:hypothetical protein
MSPTDAPRDLLTLAEKDGKAAWILARARHRHAVQWRLILTGNQNTASYADRSNCC